MVAKVPGLIHMYRCNRRKQKLAPGSRERKETCGKPLFLFHWSKFRNKHIPEPILGKKTLRQGQFPCAAPSLPFPAPPLCCRWGSTYPENHEHHKGVKQVQCELTLLFNWVFFWQFTNLQKNSKIGHWTSVYPSARFPGPCVCTFFNCLSEKLWTSFRLLLWTFYHLFLKNKDIFPWRL